MTWQRKHLLDIESLSVDEIVTVLDTARAFKAVGERAIKKVPALRGKTVVNLFVEPSSRTRISFELAETRLSADVINFSAEEQSKVRIAKNLKSVEPTNNESVTFSGPPGLAPGHPSGDSHAEREERRCTTRHLLQRLRRSVSVLRGRRRGRRSSSVRAG